jgi:septum formation protein
MRGMARRLILASASSSRRTLLERLQLPFAVDPADIDEAPLVGEAPADLALRLAIEKASAVAARHPDALVIGSDQVGVCRGRLLGKPGTAEKAEAQLQWMQGASTFFHCGLCLIDSRDGRRWQALEECEVALRPLDAASIQRYVALENPLGSAGSFLAESLGCALFEHIRSDDPTTLIGLPLIRLCQFLREAGVDPLGQ